MVASRDPGDDDAHGSATTARTHAVRVLAMHEEALCSAIAARLHDEPVQLLTGASLRVGLLRRQLEDLLGHELPPSLAEGLVETERLVLRTIESLRREMDELRAPTEFSDDLGDALRTQVQRAGLDDRYDVVVAGGDPPEPLPGVIYRLTRDVLRAAPVDADRRRHRLEVTVTDASTRLVVPVSAGAEIPEHVSSWVTALDGGIRVEHLASGEAAVVVVLPGLA